MPVFPPAPNNANTYLPPVLVIPGSLLITAITKAYPMVVSIVNSSVNTYIVGQNVFLTIPASYGMQQANGLTGTILNINGTDFSLDIDSRMFDVFSVPGAGVKIERPASLSPAGSRNLQYNNSTNNVAFQNLNNVGN